MARRGKATGRRYLAFAILAVAGGLTIGLLLSRPVVRRPAGPPVPLPPSEAVSGTEPPPTPAVRAGPEPTPQPEAIVLNTRLLDAAVRNALNGVGEIVAEAEVHQSARSGDAVLRWRTHRIDVRTRRSTAEVLRIVEPEIARTGGRVVARGNPLTLGILRGGHQLITHEVRLVRPPATARVAVIFDDAGGSLEDIETIIALERPVTLAVLPGLRFSRDVSERATAAGLEVFLHLPLEADVPGNAMGPGGIAGAMSDEEIAATVRAGLASVPGAVGVNNHMGSRGTADERIMRAVLGVVKARGLIWVDSRTTLNTVGARLAGEMGIPTASRQVFLDNEDDAEAVRAQIRRLIEVARRQGQAIAIGHAHRLTAQVLREMLSEFDRAGIEFVPASALAR